MVTGGGSQRMFETVKGLTSLVAQVGRCAHDPCSLKWYGIRRYCFLIPAILILTCFPATSFAKRCVDFNNLNLNIIIDGSSSMDQPIVTPSPPGTLSKHELARAIGLEIYDAIRDTGHLQRAGGMGFPTLRSSAGFVLNMDPDLSLLRTRLNTLPAPDGGTSPIYDALWNGANHMATFSNDGILVALTDGINRGSGVFREDARRALINSGSWNYLVFIGNPDISDDIAGRDNLWDLASISLSGFHFARPGVTAIEIANAAINEVCQNWSPGVNLVVIPLVLDLDLADDTVTFRADVDDDFTDRDRLLLSWFITPPGEAERPWSTGSGPGYRSLTNPFVVFGQLGTWRLRLLVDDRDGGVTEARATFEVTGTPPSFERIGSSPINVLDILEFGNRLEHDARGRPQSFELTARSWPAGTRFPPEADGSYTHPVRRITNEADITRLANGGRYADHWLFYLTTTTASGWSREDSLRVEVVNLPPAGELTGASERISAGESITLASTHIDPDGGEMTWSWDIIQAPDTALDERTPDYAVGTDSSFSLTPEQALPGSWIFRLTARDNEGEAAVEEGETVSILVDAVPVPDIEADDEILSISEEFVLDGTASTDPDSPCEPPETCHSNIESEPVITPGIVSWLWTVVDRPQEYASDLLEHDVDELFGVPANQPTVSLPAGSLLPGDWTFQLKIVDGESNEAFTTHGVHVIDEGGNPVAMVSPPWRYTPDVRGFVEGPVVVSAAGSYDPDDVRRGDEDLLAFHWDFLSGPPGGESCLPGPAERDTGELELFARDTFIRSDCQGLYRIQLTVTDDDSPTPHSAQAVAVFQIGACAGVCIDYPRSALPVFVTDPASVNVPIFYQVDPAIMTDPAYVHGLQARLEIFASEDITTPVFTTDEPLFEVDSMGSSRMFSWTGHGLGFTPRTGTYAVQVTVLDPGSGAVVAYDLQHDAIVIEGSSAIMDCAELWYWGYPDLRDDDVYPCLEYEEPGIVTGTEDRIFYPPGWDLADPFMDDLLRWTAEGLRASRAAFAPHGSLGPMAVVFSNRYPLRTDYKPVAAIASLGIKLAGEPCPIIVYPTGLTFSSDDFRWVIAHEVGHCFQEDNISTLHESSSWWHEGMATYFGNMVYRHANTEFRYVARTDDRPESTSVDPFDPEVPIYTQSYASGIFFQSLVNHPEIGLAGVLRLMRILGSPVGIADPVGVLAATRGMYNAWEQFSQQLADGQVVDTGGGFWPYTDEGHTMVINGEDFFWDPDAPFIRDGSSAARIPASRFTVRNVRLEFQTNFIYDVSLSSVGVVARRSASVADRVDAWGVLPGRIQPGCSSAGAFSVDYNLVISVNPTDTAPHRTRIAVSATPDPACAP